jgi:hypothetical protein
MKPNQCWLCGDLFPLKSSEKSKEGLVAKPKKIEHWA